MAEKQQAPMTEGRRAYEAKRAAKAGVSLEKWMAMKMQDRDKATAEAARAAAAPKKPGFFARLLERAHKPLG